MNKNKLIAVSVFAAAMLAACGGDGGQSREALLKSAGVATGSAPTPQPAYQAEMKAPTQTPVYIIATSIVEATVNVPVVVTATPAPGMATECDYTAITAPLDDADKGAGVVKRGYMQPCAYATAKAMGVLP